MNADPDDPDEAADAAGATGSPDRAGDSDAAGALRPISLASATDLAGFRRACRALRAERVAPERVSWHCADAVAGDLFEAPSVDAATDAGAAAAPPIFVPPAFLTLCESVVLHRDPGRFGLLYRLLWRLQHEPGLRHDPLDADWVQAGQMAQAVRRDIHKMKAFVRFRTIAAPAGATPGSPEPPAGTAPGAPSPPAVAGAPVQSGGAASGPLHVAWFEPEHHIVEAAAPFFARRYANMRWAILTPDRCVRWDGRALEVEPGADRSQAPPADAGEALWLTYYESIFNPARLKVSMMRKEMPMRYWPNLPEARLIDPLIARAAERSSQMIDKPPTDAARRIPASPETAPQPTPGRAPVLGGAAPASLRDLRSATERCRECPIGEHATQAVPGEGPDDARLMFVGEQPGDQEDLQGRPFVGPAGQLFARAMADLGWKRDAVYITNAVKHFKFELRGKRRIHKTPAQQEAAACLHWLESEIELVQPAAIVALGATAARQLMGTPVAVTRQRGQWLTRRDGRRVLITLHPSALLRMEPADKEAAYAAWLDDLRHAARFAAPPHDPS